MLKVTKFLLLEVAREVTKIIEDLANQDLMLMVTKFLSRRVNSSQELMLMVTKFPMSDVNLASQDSMLMVTKFLLSDVKTIASQELM
jgi:hypothetical protein